MIPAGLLQTLRSHLVERRICLGFNTLDANQEVWRNIPASEPGAGELVGWLSQWVDVGYREWPEVRHMLDRFPPECRSGLSLSDYAHLRIAQAALSMAGEEWENALSHLDFVLTLAAEVADPTLSAVAHYWKARTLRQKGEYEEALPLAREGERIARALGYPCMAAVMRVLESWLLFQRGKTRESWALLQECEAVLGKTDDHVVRGNIQSAYGRLLRRQGRYEQAIAYFQRSIEEYCRVNPRHRNVARSLANMAYVKRLLALQWRRKIDADIAGRKKASSTDRERFSRFRTEALEHLHDAGEIYNAMKQHHGAGTVQVNSGLLHLDGGDLDLAAEEAEGAFALGREKDDHILMARARVLQCTIENAKLDEEMESASPHAALEYASEAIELGNLTENSRLLARAHLVQGLTLAGDFYRNTEGARAAVDAATSLVRPDSHDPLWAEIQELKARISVGGAVDVRLRAWSNGEVGNKTLLQLSEEFAEIVIPKVWEQEGRKVARVAKRLKVSPKKVRRILARIAKTGALAAAAGAESEIDSEHLPQPSRHP